MGTFALMDFFEDENLHNYTVLGTTLAMLFLGVFLLFVKEWSIHGPTKLPIFGVESRGYFALAEARREFVSDGFRVVRDAYYKHYGKNFVIKTNNCDRIVLTQAQVKELSNAPEDAISFSHATGKTFMSEYTSIDRFIGTQYLQDAVKIKLTQNLGIMKDAILEETQFALKTELPEPIADEWVSVDTFTTILKIVARISARSFIGLPLCRNEEWLTVSICFTGDLLKTVADLGGVSKLLRPFYAYLWGSSKTIDSHRKNAQSLLAPTIKQRLEERKLAEINETVPKNHNDLLHWLIDLVKPQDKTVEALSEFQLLVGLASIHTTTLVFVNTIFDLAQYPEYIQPIREEMEAVIAANGGVLDREVLRKMRKADSFFKESMRIRDSIFSFNRMVMNNTTLSDGTYLPKGTIVCAPTAALATDPEFVEEGEKFDGFRWYRKSLEVREGTANTNNCTSTSTNYLRFGFGRHACPGRFFAVEELKIILTFILLQYDIKYPEGQSRPRDIQNGEFSIPDSAQKIMFKKLQSPKKFSFL